MIVRHLDLTPDIDCILSDETQITVLRDGEIRAGLVMSHKERQVCERYSLRIATEGHLVKYIQSILQIWCTQLIPYLYYFECVHIIRDLARIEINCKVE